MEKEFLKVLYNKSAIKKRTPVTREQINLARQVPLFRLSKKVSDRLVNQFSKPEYNVYKKMEGVSNWMDSNFNHDESHSFEGIRSASRVLVDKTGHCIEKGILLYAIANKLGVSTKWRVSKNPKNYSCSELEDYGFHPFLIFECNGREYSADCFNVKEPSSVRGIVSQDMGQREFVSFCVQDAGEDFTLHGKYERAEEFLNLALRINPDNYPALMAKADNEARKGNYEKAKRLARQAVKMAPDVADTYFEYGDMLFRMYGGDLCRDAFVEAAKRDTEDLQVLNSLEKRLYGIGERKLSKDVKDRKNELKGSKKFRNYFD